MFWRGNMASCRRVASRELPGSSWDVSDAVIFWMLCLSKLSVFSSSKNSELYLQHFYNTIACVCQCTSAFFITQFSPPSSIFLPHRADASTAGPHGHGYPVQAVVPAVGELGVQPDTLPHLLSVPVLPLHHSGRRRGPQHHRARVPGSGAQRLALHAAWSATLPRHPCPSVTGQPRGEEGGQRGHLPDRGGQWVSGGKLQNGETETCHCKNSIFGWISTRIWIYQWQFISWSAKQAPLCHKRLLLLYTLLTKLYRILYCMVSTSFMGILLS